MSDKVKVVSVRMTPQEFDTAKSLSPEGNISMWMRSLVREAIEKEKTPK